MKFEQLTKIVILLVVLLGAANLITTNILATGGGELSDISQQSINLQKENMILKNKIAEHSSLSAISSQAEILGFVPISNTISIATPAPVAYVAK